MHDSCVFTLLNWLCAGRIRLGWAHAVFTIAYHMLMHFHAYVPYIFYILIYWFYLVLFCVFLSPSLSLVYISCVMVPKHNSTLSRNPLRSEASTSSDLTPSFILFRDEKAKSDFFENSLDEAFIQNTKSFYQTSPTLTYPLSFTVGVGSHCVTSRSLVHLCLSRNSTPTCMDLIIQYLSLLLAFELCALWSHRILYLTCSMS